MHKTGENQKNDQELISSSSFVFDTPSRILHMIIINVFKQNRVKL